MGVLMDTLLKDCEACGGSGRSEIRPEGQSTAVAIGSCVICLGRGKVVKEGARISVEQDKELRVLYSGDGGVTAPALRFWRKHKEELGSVVKVTIHWDRDACEYFTLVEGRHALLILEGLALGYEGEGPHGLVTLLEEAGMSHTKDEVFGGRGDEKVGRFTWRPKQGGEEDGRFASMNGFETVLSTKTHEDQALQCFGVDFRKEGEITLVRWTQTPNPDFAEAPALFDMSPEEWAAVVAFARRKKGG